MTKTQKQCFKKCVELDHLSLLKRNFIRREGRVLRRNACSRYPLKKGFRHKPFFFSTIHSVEKPTSAAQSTMNQNYDQDHLIFSDQINSYNNQIIESDVNLNSENLQLKK